MVHLEKGSMEDLLLLDPRMRRIQQPPIRDEGGHGGLVLLDGGGGEHRCSSLSSPSKEERQYCPSTPLYPLLPFSGV